MQLPGPPLLEQLEPRLLLSADLLGTQPLAPLESSLGEQAVFVSLDQNAKATQDDNGSLILTYLTSADETSPLQAGAADSLATNGDDSDAQCLDEMVQPVEENIGTTDGPAGTALSQTELGIQIAAGPGESDAPTEDACADRIVSGQQDSTTSPEASPIEARGPPANVFDALSPLSETTCGGEEQAITSAEGGVSSAAVTLVAPELPGLVLVDPDISNWQGQIVYLDFDGAQNVTHNSPVTVGPFDVPAFQAPGELAGQEQIIIDQVLAELQDTFAGSGVVFTTQGILSAIGRLP